MSTIKKKLTEKQRLQNMSKEQIQLAIKKKKECDAKALAIVKQLLEPNVNPDWLCQNLPFISKCHMEDVIEERAIVKLCGYVMCQNALTVTIKQQYHISTRNNKVYDVSKRKNFCSSLCYGAFNYLMEQIPESPLWLRESEDIPVFHLMPINSASARSTPGDEIDVTGFLNTDNDNVDKDQPNKKIGEQSTSTQVEEDTSISAVSIFDVNKNSNLSNDVNTEKDIRSTQNMCVDTNLQNPHICEVKLSNLYINEENRDFSYQECTNCDSNYNNSPNIKEINMKLENLPIDIQSPDTSSLYKNDNENLESKSTDIGKVCNNDNNEALQSKSEISDSQSDNNTGLKSQSGKTNKSENNETLQLYSDKICNNQHVKTSLDLNNKCRKKRNTNRVHKDKQEQSNDVKEEAIYSKLVTHVEQSVKEWITENTLRLLLNEADAKSRLLDSLTQHDTYLQLCKKLNRLELQDQQEARVNLTKNTLKPLPELSALQEEGKKLELKVRAFYKGQMIITPPEDDDKKSENKDILVMPLTDTQTPNALRRRIFLDKLSKTLPNLLQMLTINGNTSKIEQYSYNNETHSLITVLVSTFNLSAANVVFKTAEWTLVGLIIIKMLSLIDAQLQSLFTSKQASMYTSMILMSYKLESNYLDELIVEIINNLEISRPNCINDEQNIHTL